MLSVGADPVVVEQQLVSGGLACPDCGQRLAPWGYAAPRFVREAGRGAADPAAAGDLLAAGGLRAHARVVAPVLPGQAGRCGGGDLVGVAGPGGGLGVAADLRGGGSPGLDGAGVAVAVRRARRADPGRVRAAGTPGGGGADMDRLAPAASPTADAVAQIGAACAAVRRAAGPACSRCRRRSWWRRVRAAGCWGRGRRRWRRCRSTRARVCDRAPRRVRVDGVTAVDHEKR